MTTVVLVQQGGTGANSAAGARAALGAVANTGGTITGQLNLTGSGVALNVANNVFFGSNVAIGRQVENFPLYVERGTLGVTGVFINEDGTANPRIVLYGNANGSVIQHTYSSGADSLLFSIGGSIGDGAEAMRINSSRNVGIGTNNPTSRLDVSGTVKISDDLYVSGNIFLQGNTTFINVATLNISDPLLYLAANNDLSDTVDIGFMGGKNTAGIYSHTGLARDATDGKWKLFDGLAEEGHIGNVIDFANTVPGTLVANVESSNVTSTGNITFSGTGLRIRGDMSNATIANRLAFQTSVADSSTTVLVLPNGTGTNAQLLLRGGSTAANDSFGQIVLINNTEFRIASSNNLAGVVPPMTFLTGSTERMRISNTGNVGIGTNSPTKTLEIGLLGTFRMQTGSVFMDCTPTAGATDSFIWNTSANAIYSWQMNSSERMRIAANGYVGIGTTSPAGIIHVRYDAGASDNYTGKHIFQTTDQRLTIGTYWQSGVGQYSTIQSESASAVAQSLSLNPSGGNVGIGTNAPSAKLTVSGGYINQTNGTVTTFIGADGSGGSLVGTSTNHYFRVITNNSERARFSAAGGFSVGTTADPGVGAIFATGNITAYYSDARLKEFRGRIKNALDKVGKLNGYYYVENEIAAQYGYTNKEEQVGVSAQEVEAVLPHVVANAPFDLALDENGIEYSKSGEDYKTVRYERLVPLLIEAIKELKAEIEVLKQK